MQGAAPVHNRPKNLNLYGLKKGKAIDPYLGPLEEAAPGNLLQQLLHQAMVIGIHQLTVCRIFQGLIIKRGQSVHVF